MLRRLLGTLLVFALLLGLPALSGCNDDQDEIEVHRTTEVKNQPVGDPQPVVE
ncbi:MAG TPA: hypothetical protein VNA25_08825 [Phycisphaerae bacterium]|nr:hypothetical protein [Phycisphaerae bacterium]HUT57939.1 hypothetical protein [Phycisphaerae bacterium]